MFFVAADVEESVAKIEKIATTRTTGDFFTGRW
jgi:hypothetical protein